MKKHPRPAPKDSELVPPPKRRNKKKAKDKDALREHPRMEPYKREHDYVWLNSYGDDE